MVYPRCTSRPCLATRSVRNRRTSPSMRASATWAYRLCSSDWISATVRRPSHSSTIAAPVALTTQTVSGDSSACCPRAASYLIRTCGARRGRAESSMCAISLVDGIEHAPQHVAFEGQRRERRGLRLLSGAVLAHHLQTVLGVFGRLGNSRPKIRKLARVDPGVMTFECGEPVGHQVRREEFGQ